MEKNIIVAIADNWAIGRDNALLWHIAEDMKYFRKVTSGHAVIMGRKTFDSIGRPLPKRQNIVLSRTASQEDFPEGIQVARTLEEAYSLVSESCSMSASDGSKSCFVIGGGQIYSQAFESADNLYITHVHTVIEDADTFFPVIDKTIWTEKSRSETHLDPETGFSFEFVIYSRS